MKKYEKKRDMSSKSIDIERYKELFEAFEEAKDHLDCIAYGDTWERECAYSSGLVGRIEQEFEKASKIINAFEESTNQQGTDPDESEE